MTSWKLYAAIALAAAAFLGERAWMAHRINQLQETADRVPKLELEIDRIQARQRLFSEASSLISQADDEAEAVSQQSEDRINEIAEPEDRADSDFWSSFFDELRGQNGDGGGRIPEPSVREAVRSKSPDGERTD